MKEQCVSCQVKWEQDVNNYVQREGRKCDDIMIARSVEKGINNIPDNYKQTYIIVPCHEFNSNLLDVCFFSAAL